MVLLGLIVLAVWLAPEKMRTGTEFYTAFGAGIGVAFAFFFSGGIYAVFARYSAKRFTYVIEHTRWGDLAFCTPRPITAMSLVRLILGNIIAMLFSLTLLYPVVVRRSLRYWCDRIGARGTVDFTRISQAEAISGTGEGLAGYFNVDAMGG